MTVLYVLLLLLAVLCFALSAARKDLGKVDTLSLGLVFAFLVPLIQYLNK